MQAPARAFSARSPRDGTAMAGAVPAPVPAAGAGGGGAGGGGAGGGGHLVGVRVILNLLGVHLEGGEDGVVEADVDAHHVEGERVGLVRLRTPRGGV